MSKYLKKAQEIANIVEQKNKSYGDSFNKAGGILKILFPDGINPEQYTDVLSIARIIDKLFRIANNKNAFGENPYEDMVGYALLGSLREKKEE